MKTKLTKNIDLGRRKFLGKAAGATAGISLAPGVVLYDIAQARPDNEPASATVRWGMLVDTNRCKSGCDDCVSACSKENGWDKEEGRAETKVQWIRKVDLKEKSTGREVSLPMMCQHCAGLPHGCFL